MLNKCAVYLTNKLCESISTPDNKKEIYIYGFEITLSTLIAILSIICISLLFNNILFFVSFLLFFYSIRLFCGGYHASSYFRCFLLTNTIFMSTILLTKLIVICGLKWFVLVLVLLSSAIIFLFSPIQNKNHPYSYERYCKYKSISKGLTISYTITYILLFLFVDSKEIVIQAGWSYIWVSLMIIIELLRRRDKNAFHQYGNSNIS